MTSTPAGQWAELIGQRVKVHFNLHTHRYSVTALTGDRKGRVVASVPDITLGEGVDFRVSRAGWERSQRLGRRTVHAWCLGVVHAVNSSPDLGGLLCVTYHPLRQCAFHRTDDGTPITRAQHVIFAKTAPDAEHGYAWLRPGDDLADPLHQGATR